MEQIYRKWCTNIKIAKLGNGKKWEMLKMRKKVFSINSFFHKSIQRWID